MGISFGTDGWRAILNEDFNSENVERVALAIGKYVYDKYGYNKLFLIGYDPRNMAKEFATECAELLYQKGFKVELSERVVPTPVLAYNTLAKNAVAIMFTASHNPPEYLGMKFIPDYAGPATSDITDEIINDLDLDYPFGRNGSIETVDFTVEYDKHLEKIIDFKSIKKLKETIVYDGLYSASIGYLDELLKKHGISFDSINMEYDINFGGGMPDPKPKYLKDLIEIIKNKENAIGIATDGDADRFGVINENGEYVSPNEIIAILLKYLVKKGYKGSVVKTVGSSLLIDNVAKSIGVDVIETAVGFKHVGNAMRENKVIIGGEESGGLSIYGHIPEKDGVLANLLVLEVIADSDKTLVELQNEIAEIGGKFYQDRTDLKVNSKEDIACVLNVFKSVKLIGKYDVTETDLKDGVKLMLGENTKILVRPSGTEPLLRIYFETNNKDKLEELKTLVGRMVEQI